MASKINPSFGIFILILVLYFVLVYFLHHVLRKWLNVEKKPLWSYHHVNARHKKIDWAIRIVFTVLLIISFFVNGTQNFSERIWYFETYVILIAFVTTSELAKMIMEKRYAANKNDYIFTAIQLGMLLVFFFVVLSTDFFGLF